MRPLPLVVCLSLAGIGLLAAVTRGTQDAGQELDMAQAMQLAQPGPEHALLGKYVG